MQDFRKNVYAARLSKRDLDRIRDWPVQVEVPVEGGGLGEFETKTVKMRFDASNLEAIYALRTDFANACHVVTAWLQPQWEKFGISPTDWEEELTTDFVAGALDALGELLLRSMPAQTREAVHKAALTASLAFLTAIEQVGAKVLAARASTPSGTSTLESVDSDPTPTT